MKWLGTKTILELVWNTELTDFDFGPFRKPTEIEKKEAASLHQMNVVDFLRNFTHIKIEICYFKHEKRGEPSFTHCLLREHNLSCWHIRIVMLKFMIAIAVWEKLGKIKTLKAQAYREMLKNATPRHSAADKRAFQWYDDEWIEKSNLIPWIAFVGPRLLWKANHEARNDQIEIGITLTHLRDEIVQKLETIFK